MTSNQLNYWKLKEEERTNRVRESEEQRSNKAKEAENLRHNLTTEDLERMNQVLEKEGLRIKNVEALSKVANVIGNYGKTTWDALPLEEKKQLYDAMGIPWSQEAMKTRNEVASIWEVINRGWERISGSFRGIGSIIGALF